MSQRKSPLDKYLGTLGTGTVQWIGVRPGRREPLQSLIRVQAVADLGLEFVGRFLELAKPAFDVGLYPASCAWAKVEEPHLRSLAFLVLDYKLSLTH